MKKRAEDIRIEMWDTKLPDFQVRSVPDKWKNESAVIIAQTFKNVYFKEPLIAILSENSYVHKRILLQDKSAVEEYSEFKIPNDRMSVQYYAGFKVIKPNGQEKIIDLATLVKMQQKINNQNENYNKLAIPDLSPGDIIDFYLGEEKSINIPGELYYEFNTAIYVLAEKYPILKQRFHFDVLRRCYINFKSMNGAPDLQSANENETETKHFSLVDENRDKIESSHWFYPYRSVPTIKFKVTFSKTNIIPFQGTAGVVKREVTKPEIEKFMTDFSSSFSSYLSGDIKSYLKKYHKNEKDPEKLVKLIHYYYRNRYFAAEAEQDFVYQTDASRRRYFPLIVADVLKSKSIPYDLCLATPRYLSTLEDIIMSNETAFFLRVNNPTPFFVFENSIHSDFQEIDSDYQGVKSYFLTSDELNSHRTRQLKTLTVPVTNAADSRTEKRIEVLLDKNDFSAVKIKEHSVIKGAGKSYYQSQLLSPYDFLPEEQAIAPIEPILTKAKKGEKANLSAKIDSRKEEHRKELSDYLKKDYEEEFKVTVSNIDDVTILNTGRMPEKPELVYSVSAKIEGLMKKVGPDYMIEAGKLIGGQITLTEEEKTKRLHDIYMPYARSFGHTITLRIPDGYTVQGLEKFNSSVKNVTGGFESEAILNGNEVVIKAHKYYTHNFESNKQWPQLVAFLEAAYTFTQQKLLLKKTAMASN